MKRVRDAFHYLLENSIFFLAGTVAGLVWANVDRDSYEALRHARLWVEGPTIEYVVNDVLMAFFFAIAAKEVWEATLPGGPLSDRRRAATPLLATIGGMVGPIGVYLAGCAVTGTLAENGRGWAIPCATDIAFSYLVARWIFGAAHPALQFLLLLAIADDALGIAILAAFYPQGEVAPAWLGLAAAGVGLGLVLRRAGFQSFWWYLAGPGVLSWIGFARAGLHPALALVPVIPTLPHAHSDLGIFMRSEVGRPDALNAFESWWERPVELVLCLFGLLNAGVEVSAFGMTGALVLAGLLLGKPLGILAFGIGAKFGLGLALPDGMTWRDLLVVGLTAGIGFTVSLFVATVAFPAGPTLDSAKMGALASLSAALAAFVAARALGIRRQAL